MFTSPMQSPRGGCLGLPLGVEGHAYPREATASHLSCPIFLAVLVSKTERTLTIFMVALSLKSVSAS